MGALSGPNASIVAPSVDGAELALDQWENDECEVTLERFDTEGDPAKATPVATPKNPVDGAVEREVGTGIVQELAETSKAG